MEDYSACNSTKIYLSWTDIDKDEQFTWENPNFKIFVIE